MKKKKIYFLKYSEGMHIAIKELVEHPPKGYEFIVESNKGVSINKISKFKSNKLVNLIYTGFFNKIINPYKIMKILYRFKKIPDCDFIYSFGTLVPYKKNWVVEMDSIWDLQGNYKYKIEKRRIEKSLSSPYCKKIMPWSSYAKRIMEEKINTEAFKDKIEVVHPAAYVPKPKKKAKSNIMKMLFVGTSNQINDLAIYSKGIREVVRAFNILNKKYKNIKLVIVSQIPDELKKEVEENKNIKVVGIVPREKVLEIYNDCDFYIYPGYFTQSLSIIEALGSGLPVISNNTYTDDNDSMVDDGKNGFLIRIPNKESWVQPTISDFPRYMTHFYEKNSKIIIEQIIDKASKLIENASLRKKMGKKSREKYLKGYSIEARNKKLRKILDKI